MLGKLAIFFASTLHTYSLPTRDAVELGPTRWRRHRWRPAKRGQGRWPPQGCQDPPQGKEKVFLLTYISWGCTEFDLPYLNKKFCRSRVKNILFFSQSSTLNAESDSELAVTGFRPVWWRVAAGWCLVLLTAGLAKLVFYWVPHWELWLTHEVVDLGKAERVLITVSGEGHGSFCSQLGKSLGECLCNSFFATTFCAQTLAPSRWRYSR